MKRNRGGMRETRGRNGEGRVLEHVVVCSSGVPVALKVGYHRRRDFLARNLSVLQHRNIHTQRDSRMKFTAIVRRVACAESGRESCFA